MPIKVSDELRKSLPEPDAKGIVRANVALRVEGDLAHVLEINDVPVSYSKDKKSDDDDPMPANEVPDLYQSGP